MAVTPNYTLYIEKIRESSGGVKVRSGENAKMGKTVILVNKGLSFSA